jgi:hypothetical protein
MRLGEREFIIVSPVGLARLAAQTEKLLRIMLSSSSSIGMAGASALGGQQPHHFYSP